MNRILLFAMMLLLWGCKEKENEAPSIGMEVINKNALYQTLFADQREATSVNFTTTGTWTSSVSAGANVWITFSPTNGEAGQHSISMDLLTNVTGKDRTAIFTIHCGGKDEEISITQKAVDKNGHLYNEDEKPKIEAVASATLNQEFFADQRIATSVVFVTTEAWTSSITAGADEWITYNPEQGSTFGRFTIAIMLKRNTTGIDRTAEIIINCGGEELVITLSQKAVDRYGNLYEEPSDDEEIEAYFNRDWAILQNAKAQALAENRTPISPPAIQKILFVACTNTSLGGVKYSMDETQKQFVRDVAKNYEEVVAYYSNNNVIIQKDIVFIDREVVIPNVNPTLVTQETIQAELDIYAPIGEYDGILVTAAKGIPNVHMGVKTAGYENLYGYAWFSLYIPTGGQTPPTSSTYVVPKADEAPFLSTDVAVHEWLHQLEFLDGLLDYTFPPVHAYMGPPEFPGYTQYPGHPVWDFADYYRDLMSGNVPYTSGGTTRKIGMFPLMWQITPSFLNSKATYIVNEGNGLYLTYSGGVTTYSETPTPWYLRYNGKFNNEDKYLVLTSDNRSLDISNAWNSEGNAVGIFGVNPGYPQAQNWRITKNSDGTYKLTTTFDNNNKVLQRNTGSTHATGTTINSDNSSLDQRWRFTH